MEADDGLGFRAKLSFESDDRARLSIFFFRGGPSGPRPLKPTGEGVVTLERLDTRPSTLSYIYIYSFIFL